MGSIFIPEALEGYILRRCSGSGPEDIPSHCQQFTPPAQLTKQCDAVIPNRLILLRQLAFL
eukprot:11162428-Alexandrium_andersonii.AAC.1